MEEEAGGYCQGQSTRDNPNSDHRKPARAVAVARRQYFLIRHVSGYEIIEVSAKKDKAEFEFAPR